VEQATKEVAIPLDADGGESGDKNWSPGGKTFNKKYYKGSYADKKRQGVPELMKGVSFTISRDTPDMYLKAVMRLGLYICTHLQEWIWCADVPKQEGTDTAGRAYPIRKS